jgi:hypothetical protein
MKYHLRAKHATDHDTRTQHHFYPSCQTVFCCTFYFQPFSTTKGRTLHEKRVHGDQIGEQQGGTQQNIEEANDEETVASGASQAIISFNPIPANIIQPPQPLIAHVVQEVGNPHAIDQAMGNQGVHLILEEEITPEGLLNTFNHGIFTLHHR